MKLASLHWISFYWIVLVLSVEIGDVCESQIQVKMCGIMKTNQACTYKAEDLLSLGQKPTMIPSNIENRIRDLGIHVNALHSSRKRGGVNIRRNITSRIMNRSEVWPRSHYNGAVLSNLISVLPSHHSSPFERGAAQEINSIITSEENLIAIGIKTIVSKRDVSPDTRGVCSDHLTNIKIEQCDLTTSKLSHNVNFSLLNARSVRNKVNEIVDYVVDNSLDIVALTETWLGPAGTDCKTEGDLCPPGFRLLLSSRSQGRGGGVALLFKSSLKYKCATQDNIPKSFEFLEVTLYTQGCPTQLIVIYRPPPSAKNKLTVTQFYTEFSSFLEEKVLSTGRLCIVGDFNFHVDNSENKDATKFVNLLESFDLIQHVNQPTHARGHVLDLIITRSSEQLIEDIVVKDMQISDHFWIHCSLQGQKPRSVKKEISFRKMKSINIQHFEEDINASTLSSIDSYNSADEAVSAYNTELSTIMDKHAPIITKTFTLHPEAPWYNTEIDVAKKERRKAEKTWRKSKLTVHREIFVMKKEKVNQCLKSAKENYYSDMISDPSNQKSLFKIVDKISHKKSETILPDHSSPQKLANRFGEFFTDKIVKIRQRLVSVNESVNIPHHHNEEPAPPPLDTLTPCTTDEIQKLVMTTKATTCKLDPIPTSFLKIIIDVLLPILTHIINLSFKEGSVPSDLKRALIIPLLKKSGIDPEILKNFRPISNLTYLSKLMERVVAKRLLDHMLINDLHELLQSSYKPLHSTETALLRIQSDILTALDNRKCVLLVMLDLSAAFDTIDHPTLLSRLKSVIGLSGNALKWFSSYISGRFQSVLIKGVESRVWQLLFGVPQGSVLGPLLFIIYTSPLGKILRSLGVEYHFYADDTQIYITFDIIDADAAATKVEEAVMVIKDWMAKNFLCLNDDKTEVLVIASKTAHDKLNIPHIKIGSENIIPALSAKNIGFIFDHVLDCNKQINAICKSAWYHLRTIGKIREYLDNKSTEQLIHAFITSKLDFNNCLLYGLPGSLLKKLQAIQNAAARVVSRMPKHCHITPLLVQLHWLPIPQRISYKVLLMVFKALNNLAPSYITEMLAYKQEPSRSLRSNNRKLLVRPRSNTVRYGDRNFKNVAPMLWNNLPLEMRNCGNVNDFKKQLKTHLFHDSFD